MVKNRAILVVEDHPNVADSFKFILEDHYRVDVEFTGRQALDRVKTGDYDVIILDYVLPDMNGLEVFETIKKMSLPSKPRVIFVTAIHPLRVALESWQAGAFDFFGKPFDVEEFLKSIADAVKVNGAGPAGYTSPTLERKLIIGLLQKFEGSQTTAARLMGVDSDIIIKRIRNLGIGPSDIKGRSVF